MGRVFHTDFGDRKMKTLIAALALLSLAAGPVFAAGPDLQLHDGRTGIHVPYSGGLFGGSTETSREGLIHAN
jgi:hypothetical protein